MGKINIFFLLLFVFFILTGCLENQETKKNEVRKVETKDEDIIHSEVVSAKSTIEDDKSDEEITLQEKDEKWIWDGVNNYILFRNGHYVTAYQTFVEAVSHAKKMKESTVYFRGDKDIVWQSSNKSTSKLINAPLISQLPELPRGCEVTSLAMLLRTAGISEAKVNKTKLAKEIKRDTTPYKKENGQIFFGNPYDGFVGDMYSLNTPGYGVYHGPLAELAEQYIPNKVINMTGSEFEDIMFPVSNGNPVLVIHNSWFKKLPESQFQTWNTPTGKVKITMREHSVLITGYDKKYIYFNDPLSNIKNKKVNKKDFIDGWIQMGKQAITYVK